MRSLIPFRTGLVLLLVVLPLFAADDFRLHERRVKAPEMGEILTYVLTNGSDEFAFVPPTDWRVSVEPERRRVLFQSRDRNASLF